MIFTEDRIYSIAHIVTDSIWNDDLVDYSDEDKAVREVRKVLMEYCSRDEKIAETVRQKILSLKKSVYEGSREWEVLYKKYYEEETKKHL